MLHKINLPNFKTSTGHTQDILLSYELFGQPLHEAPIVLVNHALTGNSNVAGENGWWNSLIGDGKCIDTQRYTVLSFNVPGNGYDGFVIDNYKDFIAQDVARIFLWGLQELKVNRLFALIGGSMGGGIAWEMAVLDSKLTEHLIPVASDWKSTDWLIANCQIQEQFLVNSKQPVHDARMHAMLCYRTPESFSARFQRTTNEEQQVFNVESWLLHHGKKLQERFQLSAYKLMNQILKTIDVSRDGLNGFKALENSDTNIHIIGVDSDLFFTAAENRATFKQLAQAKGNVTYGEVHSPHGHDAFLIEYDQMEQLLRKVFQSGGLAPKVLKFGGKSLGNGNGLPRVLDIIQEQYSAHPELVVVCSARGKATDQLESLLETAASGRDFQSELDSFITYQQEGTQIRLQEEKQALGELLKGIAILRDYSEKNKDQVLAFGELISVKTVVAELENREVPAFAVDSRALLLTDSSFGNAQLMEEESREKVQAFFASAPKGVAVVTGFISANSAGQTTTLGRNGSNYSAALFANFLDASELRNYTHVDGIFTADPSLVPEARKIEKLSYAEANELANFGANILHAKTILPLIEKNIPLRILNTFNSDNEGTLISAESPKGGIRSLSVLEHVALVNLEGRGLLGKVGVDARIFKALGQAGISVSIISQGSSERGIGLVVDAQRADDAKKALHEEFRFDFQTQDMNAITVLRDVSVISVVGQDLSTFHQPYNALVKNQIVPLLFNNTVSGRNISLVIRKNQLHKALNVMHGQIFGISTKINIAVFGHGNVGGTLIDQILDSSASILERKGIQLQVFAVANSRKVVLDAQGVNALWRTQLESHGVAYTLDDIIAFADTYHLENLIAVDNTASGDFVAHYPTLVAHGFDLVSSNKIANTLPISDYRALRDVLAKNQKNYLYETNVGAGLPLIDTIKLLHLSGENITRIRGVFSGSLSYIFNTYSERNTPFSEVLKTAMDSGFTEPDPREDLCGNDVGRKLLILARELDLENEFSDVAIENLVPEGLRDLDKNEFLKALGQLDSHFESVKSKQESGHVLRYVGDLHGDLQQDKGILEVKLVSVPKESALGQVKGPDSIIEIYTESYGDQPLVIQGAGAGAAVTARGVFGDILRIAEKG